MQAQPIERYFTVLGLEAGASLADVKEAYRFLVQTFHEDKYPADSPYKARAHEKMVELNDAVSVRSPCHQISKVLVTSLAPN